MAVRSNCVAIPILAGILMAGCGASKSDGETIPVRDRKPVSHAAFLDSGGQRSTLADRSGKVVLVDVWATWCPPCRQSLPEIAALQKKAGDEYEVLAVSVDRDGWRDVLPFLRQNSQLGLKAWIPAGTEGIAPFGGIRYIPTTLVIDRQGRIRARWSGYIPGQAERALAEALKEPS
jgi:thiol-disulfide isomerase/thioredoxin